MASLPAPRRTPLCPLRQLENLQPVDYSGGMPTSACAPPSWTSLRADTAGAPASSACSLPVPIQKLQQPHCPAGPQHLQPFVVLQLERLVLPDTTPQYQAKRYALRSLLLSASHLGRLHLVVSQADAPLGWAELTALMMQHDPSPAASWHEPAHLHALLAEELHAFTLHGSADAAASSNSGWSVSLGPLALLAIASAAAGCAASSPTGNAPRAEATSQAPTPYNTIHGAAFGAAMPSGLPQPAWLHPHPPHAFLPFTPGPDLNHDTFLVLAAAWPGTSSDAVDWRTAAYRLLNSTHGPLGPSSMMLDSLLEQHLRSTLRSASLAANGAAKGAYQSLLQHPGAHGAFHQWQQQTPLGPGAVAVQLDMAAVRAAHNRGLAMAVRAAWISTPSGAGTGCCHALLCACAATLALKSTIVTAHGFHAMLLAELACAPAVQQAAVEAGLASTGLGSTLDPLHLGHLLSSQDPHHYMAVWFDALRGPMVGLRLASLLMEWPCRDDPLAAPEPCPDVAHVPSGPSTNVPTHHGHKDDSSAPVRSLPLQHDLAMQQNHPRMQQGAALPTNLVTPTDPSIADPCPCEASQALTISALTPRGQALHPPSPPSRPGCDQPTRPLQHDQPMCQSLPPMQQGPPSPDSLPPLLPPSVGPRSVKPAAASAFRSPCSLSAEQPLHARQPSDNMPPGQPPPPPQQAPQFKGVAQLQYGLGGDCAAGSPFVCTSSAAQAGLWYSQSLHAFLGHPFAFELPVGADNLSTGRMVPPEQQAAPDTTTGDASGPASHAGPELTQAHDAQLPLLANAADSTGINAVLAEILPEGTGKLAAKYAAARLLLDVSGLPGLPPHAAPAKVLQAAMRREHVRLKQPLTTVLAKHPDVFSVFERQDGMIVQLVSQSLLQAAGKVAPQ